MRSLLVLLAVLAACARNPVSGRPEFVVMSAEKERALGAEAADQVVKEMGTVTDPALVGYVGELGRRLGAGSPRQDVTYSFAVVDRPEPNAFALPGGPVFVTRGLLALMNAEDELAGVVAHEVAHVAARHSVQRVSRAAPLGVVTGIASVAAGLAVPGLGQAVGGLGDLAGAALLAPYGRDQEREADRVGQEIAARTGWDPAGLTRALQGMEGDERLESPEARRESFLDTHPQTPERVAATAAYARQLTVGAASPVAATRDDFLRRLDGLVVGQSAAEGQIRGTTFLHPTLGFVLQAPAGWTLQNGRTAVAALSPEKDGMVVLRLVGEGTDPAVGWHVFERANGVRLNPLPEKTTSNGLPMVRARTQLQSRRGPMAVDLAWVTLGGRVYELVQAVPLNRVAAHRGTFDGVLRGFRPLRAADRPTETRLRLVAARAGETVADVGRRAGSRWDARMMAVANGVEAGTRLEAGRLVKIAREEPWTP